MYTGASASDPTHAALNRAGLGAAVVNPDGSPNASLHAALPTIPQASGVGQIFVAGAILALCVPPVSLISD